jgi:RHS repeat-associated protein
VTAITDTSGNVLERYVYDAYGQPTFLTASWGTEGSSAYAWTYLFQGDRYDAGTTDYNFRNRDYSPNLDRWLENDPIGFAGGQTNLYGAEGSNPTNGSDPMGLDDNSKQAYEAVKQFLLGTAKKETVGRMVDVTQFFNSKQEYPAGDLTAFGRSLSPDVVLTGLERLTPMQRQLIELGRHNRGISGMGRGYYDEFGYHKTFCMSCHDPSDTGARLKMELALVSPEAVYGRLTADAISMLAPVGFEVKDLRQLRQSISRDHIKGLVTTSRSLKQLLGNGAYLTGLETAL